jgi:hypothetical protein
MAFGFGRTTVAAAQVTVTADTTGMTKGLKSAESSMSSFRSTTVGHANAVVGALGKVAKWGAVGAIGAGFLAFKSGFDDMEQGQKVAAQTAAVLKSTGNAAHVTAKQVADYANAVQAKTGVDDASVQSGQNLLLTFTNIKNAAGKGNDIFNQTRQTMVDLSVAFGQDTKSSAIMLGKALQDPVKGMSALTRVGVTFSSAQQTAIKHMVATGNTLGAQKLMLKAVNQQVAGSADAYGKTLPGMIARAKGWLDNFTGGLIAKVIPAIAKMVEWIDKFAHSKEFQSWLAKAKDALDIFMGVVKQVWGFIEAHQTLFKYLAIGLGVAIGLILAITVATIAWGAAVALVTSPLTIVIVAIALLAAGLIYAYQHCKTFHAIVDTAFHAAVAIIKNTVGAMVGAIKNIIKVVKDVVNLIGDLIHGRWGALWGDAKQLAVDAVHALMSFINAQFAGLPGLLLKAVGAVGGAAKRIGSAIFNGITGLLGGMGQAVVGAMRSAMNSLIDAANSGLNTIHDNWPDVPGAPGPPFGHNPIGHVAFGGPVRGGRAYIVGENGPELVIPGGDSYVANTAALMKALGGFRGGQGGQVNITIQSLHPADPDTLRRVSDFINQGQGMLNNARLYNPVLSPGL